MDMDEPSHENSSLTNRFTTRHGTSTANRECLQGDFSPSLYSFDSSQSGINRRLSYNQLQNPVDFFRIFFDQNLMETIVRQTNMYQSQNPQSSSSHMASWVDVSVSELYIFLAMTILMSQVKKHKIREYWSTDPLIETRILALYLPGTDTIHCYDIFTLSTTKKSLLAIVCQSLDQLWMI
jgi:hypothetical protein